MSALSPHLKRAPAVDMTSAFSPAHLTKIVTYSRIIAKQVYSRLKCLPSMQRGWFEKWSQIFEATNGMPGWWLPPVTHPCKCLTLAEGKQKKKCLTQPLSRLNSSSESTSIPQDKLPHFDCKLAFPESASVVCRCKLGYHYRDVLKYKISLYDFRKTRRTFTPTI